MKGLRAALLLLLAGGAVSACVPAELPAPATPDPGAERPTLVGALVHARPSEAGMHPALTARLDSILEEAIAEGAAPGAALAVGRHGRLVHYGGYGRLDWDEASLAADGRSIYDLASLTKVVGTATAAVMLEEGGLLELDTPVHRILPELGDTAKAAITVRMLLEHTSGLESFAPLWREGVRGRAAYLAEIDRRPLEREPGTRSVYSDWNMILLQLAIERITGRTLDAFLEEEVFGPLGMTETGFNPDEALLPRIAPTEVDPERGGLVHGMVHDENAWAMGGVAGHAGMFSSARDLAVFAQMMLNGGEYDGTRILRPETIARWTAPQMLGSSRALGWDTPSGRSSGGRYTSPWAFGHTGFTGTSMWMDPARGTFVILLTNRVNPTRDNRRHIPLRRDVADAVHESILDAPLVDWEARR